MNRRISNSLLPLAALAGLLAAGQALAHEASHEAVFDNLVGFTQVPDAGGSSQTFHLNAEPGSDVRLSVANLALHEGCTESARVIVDEHVGLGHGATTPGDGVMSKEELLPTKLASIRLDPGERGETWIPGDAERPVRLLQVRVIPKDAGPAQSACVEAVAHVFRDDGSVEPVMPTLPPVLTLEPTLQEAVCIGSTSCEKLQVSCEKDKDCSFSCHLVLDTGGPQPCQVGSTD